MENKLTCEIKNSGGTSVGSLDLDPTVFNAEINKTAVHAVVRLQRASARAGTASTLTRSDMKGGGKKPWKQKGTGRARAGSNISPLWPGGAVVFGPKPRKYDFKLNREHKRQAIVSVLSDKALSQKLIIIEDLKLPEMKTKLALDLLEKNGLTDQTVLVVLAKNEEGLENAHMAFRNIPSVMVCNADYVNVYDVLNHKYLLCTKEAIAALTARCGLCCSCSCN